MFGNSCRGVCYIFTRNTFTSESDRTWVDIVLIERRRIGIASVRTQSCSNNVCVRRGRALDCARSRVSKFDTPSLVSDGLENSSNSHSRELITFSSLRLFAVECGCARSFVTLRRRAFETDFFLDSNITADRTSVIMIFRNRA